MKIIKVSRTIDSIDNNQETVNNLNNLFECESVLAFIKQITEFQLKTAKFFNENDKSVTRLRKWTADLDFVEYFLVDFAKLSEDEQFLKEGHAYVTKCVTTYPNETLLTTIEKYFILK